MDTSQAVVPPRVDLWQALLDEHRFKEKKRVVACFRATPPQKRAERAKEKGPRPPPRWVPLPVCCVPLFQESTPNLAQGLTLTSLSTPHPAPQHHHNTAHARATTSPHPTSQHHHSTAHASVTALAARSSGEPNEGTVGECPSRLGSSAASATSARFGRDSFCRPSTHRAPRQQAPYLTGGFGRSNRRPRRGYVDKASRINERIEAEEEEWTLFPHKELFEISGAEEAARYPVYERVLESLQVLGHQVVGRVGNAIGLQAGDLLCALCWTAQNWTRVCVLRPI